MPIRTTLAAAGQARPSRATGSSCSCARTGSTISTIRTCRPCSPGCRRRRRPAQRFVAVRNPYFYRVDSKGQQLPYLDRFILRGRRPEAGPDQDRRRRDRPAGPPPVLQGLHLPQARASSAAACDRCCGPRAAARIWRCIPNLNARDPVWRGAVPRPALPPGALAWARSGGAERVSSISAWPSHRTTRSSRQSPLYREEFGKRCIAYDPEAANRLLDEFGPRPTQSQRHRGCCRTGGRWS